MIQMDEWVKPETFEKLEIARKSIFTKLKLFAFGKYSKFDWTFFEGMKKEDKDLNQSI